MRGNQFAFSGGNGVPGGTYYVLTSTGLQLPLANWALMATNSFDNRGYFNFVRLVAPGTAQGFYRLSLAVPSTTAVLPLTIARFKTPTLRDLGHSSPYMHTGRLNTIEEVIRFYQKFSHKARRGDLRNGDPELQRIFLDKTAVVPLAAFLRSLNEDYTD